MDNPTPKDKYEFWFETIILGILLGASLLFVITGSVACTAYHPCAVWAQITMILGGALLGVVGKTLLVLVLMPRIMERLRKRRS